MNDVSCINAASLTSNTVSLEPHRMQGVSGNLVTTALPRKCLNVTLIKMKLSQSPYFKQAENDVCITF